MNQVLIRSAWILSVSPHKGLKGVEVVLKRCMIMMAVAVIEEEEVEGYTMRFSGDGVHHEVINAEILPETSIQTGMYIHPDIESG